MAEPFASLNIRISIALKQRLYAEHQRTGAPISEIVRRVLEVSLMPWTEEQPNPIYGRAAVEDQVRK